MDEALSIDEFPRHQPSNPYNYDELTLAKRQLEINAAKRDFPHIPENVISMSWDTVHNLGESAMNEIIETKAWEKAKKKDRPQPGVYNTITIENDESLSGSSATLSGSSATLSGSSATLEKTRYVGIKGLDPEA